MNNEQYSQLVSYVSDHLRQGFSEEIIRQTLQQHGWDTATVNNVFASLASPAPAPQPSWAPRPPVLQEQPQQTYQPAQSQPAVVNEALQQPQQNPIATSVALTKYRLFRAIADTFRAIRRNPVAFVLSIVGSYVFAVGVVVLIALLTVTLVMTIINLDSQSGRTIFITLTILGYVLLNSVLQALLLAVPSLALYDGAEGRKSRFGTLFKTGIKRMWRVAVASALLWLVAIVPILIAIVLSFTFVFSAGSSSSTISLLLTPILSIASVVVMTVLLLRFSLAPYVALFEPEVPIRKTLGRSKQLLLKGGQWFLLKGVLLVFAVLLILSAATGLKAEELKNTSNITANVVALLIWILANGVVVMLYRNRRMVKQ